MGRVRPVKQSGRLCRLCRRKGSFATMYCVHGSGSAFLAGMGRLFDPYGPTTADRRATIEFKPPKTAPHNEVVRRSHMRRVLGNVVAAHVGQRAGVVDSG